LAEAREDTRRHQARALHVYQDEDGTVRIRGRLTAEQGAVLMQALASARETLYQRTRSTPSWPEDVPEGTPSMEQLQADALTLLGEAALHHPLDPGAPGERYQVVVHVDAAVLADAEAPGQSVLDGGSRVPAGTSQRLAGDATRVIMRHDADGQIVEVGARAYHSAGDPSRAPPSRPRLPVSGLRARVRPGPSHPPLGQRRLWPIAARGRSD
jgi:uncharacterized protein DUF222